MLQWNPEDSRLRGSPDPNRLKDTCKNKQIYTSNRRYICTLSPLGLRLASARSDSHWPPAQKEKKRKTHKQTLHTASSKQCVMKSATPKRFVVKSAFSNAPPSPHKAAKCWRHNLYTVHLQNNPSATVKNCHTATTSSSRIKTMGRRLTRAEICKIILDCATPGLIKPWGNGSLGRKFAIDALIPQRPVLMKPWGHRNTIRDSAAGSMKPWGSGSLRRKFAI